MRIRASKTLNAINVCRMARCALYQAEYVLECVPFFMDAVFVLQWIAIVCVLIFLACAPFYFILLFLLVCDWVLYICTLFAIVYVCCENGIFDHAPHILFVDCF